MSQICLFILLPNGRRRTLNCNLNMTVLQVIAEVCHKNGLPEANFDLKHRNTILDASSMLRHIGLPNNAQLELVPLVKARPESKVVVAVAVDSGDRVTGTFEPDIFVSDILKVLCPTFVQSMEDVAVIYMRREISGSALAATTLRHLGLINGSAMFRLVVRNKLEATSSTTNDVKNSNESADVVMRPSIERQPMIFSMDTAEPVESRLVTELPDDFFDLTIDDARRLMRDAQRMCNDIENTGFMTQEARQKEREVREQRQLSIYKKTVIRVLFADRSVIQSIFSPIETVGDVIAYVRQFLHKQALDVYLYTTPPKTILANDSRLIDNQCLPAAVLYIGCTTETVTLAPQYAQNMVNMPEATAAAAAIRAESRQRELAAIEEDKQNMREQRANSKRASALAPDQEAGPSTSNKRPNEDRLTSTSAGKVMPKWFKPPTK